MTDKADEIFFVQSDRGDFSAWEKYMRRYRVLEEIVNTTSVTAGPTRFAGQVLTREDKDWRMRVRWRELTGPRQWFIKSAWTQKVERRSWEIDHRPGAELMDPGG